MTILDGEERAVSPSDPKIRVMRKSDAYWVVTIANPPFNVVGPAEVLELQAVVDQLKLICACRS